MNCKRARGLFGACWDDELTQAEREWLEAHLAACSPCRMEYDEYSRALELASTLPRVEPAPDLVETALARARRSTAAPDRVGAPSTRWVPATVAAAAGLLVVTGLLSAPWIAWGPTHRGDAPQYALQNVKQPSLPAAPSLVKRAETRATGAAAKLPSRQASSAAGQLAAIPDSLFDHSEDVEFILDPVTLHRGRASVARATVKQADVRGQQALITF